MTNTEIIILSLSISFCVAKVWQPIRVKPFNCMMCLTGWCALFISEITYGSSGRFSGHTITLFQLMVIGVCFFFIGCFIGAIVDNAMNRYL